MELWIRSQDRSELFKVSKLKASGGAYTIATIKDVETDIGLGYYKSKKRALEVLDEIQWELSKRDLGQPNYTGIYEMPKE